MNQEILHDMAEAPFFARETNGQPQPSEDGDFHWRPHTVNDHVEKAFSVPIPYKTLFPDSEVAVLGKLGETPDTLLSRAFMALEEGRAIKPEGEGLVDFAVDGVCNGIINRLFDEEDQGTDEISASDLTNEFMPQLHPMIERVVAMTDLYFPMPDPLPDDDSFIMDAEVHERIDRTVVKVAWAR